MHSLRESAPRVHCITNYVTAGDVANMVLAAGGSPIMAQGRNEVEDVTSICQSLVLNMGTLEEWTAESMILAGKKAVSLGHPVILDPVGITASSFRRKAVMRVLGEVKPTVIRGNVSEITALEQALRGLEPGNTCGVDAADPGNGSSGKGAGDQRAMAAVSLGSLTGAVIIMTGQEDLVAGRAHVYRIKNGHPFMGRITGSGCMLDGVLGAFLGANCCSGEDRNILWEEAAAMAVCAHGLCGELAYEKTAAMKGGTGTFRMYLLDYMSMLDDEMLERGKKIEIQERASADICGDGQGMDWKNEPL